MPRIRRGLFATVLAASLVAAAPANAATTTQARCSLPLSLDPLVSAQVDPGATGRYVTAIRVRYTSSWGWSTPLGSIAYNVFDAASGRFVGWGFRDLSGQDEGLFAMSTRLQGRGVPFGHRVRVEIVLNRWDFGASCTASVTA